MDPALSVAHEPSPHQELMQRVISVQLGREDFRQLTDGRTTPRSGRMKVLDGPVWALRSSVTTNP